MAASVSSITVTPSGSNIGGGHMLASSSSMGSVYNGNSHTSANDFMHHESMATVAAHSSSTSNINHKSSSASVVNRNVQSLSQSPCLNNFLFPILNDIQRKYSNNSKNMNVMDVADLTSVFQMAERSRPGVTDLFLKEIIHKLVPGYSETRINNIMDRAIRNKK